MDLSIRLLFVLVLLQQLGLQVLQQLVNLKSFIFYIASVFY